jgi:hypothetical protein
MWPLDETDIRRIRIFRFRQIIIKLYVLQKPIKDYVAVIVYDCLITDWLFYGPERLGHEDQYLYGEI